MTRPVDINKIPFRKSIEVDADVDLVAFFKDFTEAQRKLYFELDVAEWGYEEFERPLANAMAWLDSATDGIMEPAGPGVTSRIDCDWDGVFVEWTEDDLDKLAAAVPWIQPEEIDPEDLARMPGPGDVPLPLEDA